MRELTRSEITKKIAEIQVMKSLESMIDNKSPSGLIKLSDPSGDNGPEVYDPFNYYENCKLRDDFGVVVFYDEMFVKIRSKYDGFTIIKFETRNDIMKAVLLCIIKSKENENE